MQLTEFSQSDIEEEELSGGLSADKYLQLLLHYMIGNEVLHAKFLWKRIPDEVKQGDFVGAELTRVWKIGKMLLKKDYVNAYMAMKCEWSEITKLSIARLRETLQARMLNLARKSYSSINLNTFCSMVDMELEKAVQLASQNGWTYDPVSEMLMLIKEVPVSTPTIDPQKELRLLSDYVSFLEN